MSKRETRHVPVLLKEVLEVIDPKPGQVVVDCTLGLGGHSAEILKRIWPKGKLIGFDFDPANLALAKKKFGGDRGEYIAASREFRGHRGHSGGRRLDGKGRCDSRRCGRRFDAD